MLLPIMPLSKVKLPGEDISLQLFESRYRLMFKLVHQARRRRFGVVLGDTGSATMETVGCICELRAFVPVPER